MTGDEPRHRRRGRRSLRYEFALARAGSAPARHPAGIVAVVLVDGELGPDHDGRHVTSFGALVVDVIDGEPRFRKYTRSTHNDEERGRLLSELVRLSDARHVVLASAHPLETIVDCRHVLREAAALLDLVGLEGVAPGGLTLSTGSEDWLARLGSEYGLPTYDGADLLTRARYAGTRAQLAWLAYVRMQLREGEARSLSAAFRAWQLIRRVRPRTF